MMSDLLYKENSRRDHANQSGRWQGESLYLPDNEQFERCESCGGLVDVEKIRMHANPQHDDEGNEYIAYRRQCDRCVER